MHALLSSNQLGEWKHFQQTIDDLESENEKLDDYYECLIECDVLDQAHCKRICKRILT
jgi:hypothetical protein